MGDNNVSINLVILGKEGHGKSSVGNFILKQNSFAVSRADVAPCRRQCYASGNRNNFTMKVVDMPGCPVVPLDKLQSYRNQIDEAFDRYEDKLHLFLLVIKFENENTGNCLQVFDNWRNILGPDIFANWGVIVMTFGDEFTRSMEENQTPDKKFSNWCWDQTGSLRKLFEECKWRIVIVDNTVDLDQTNPTFEKFSVCLRDMDLTHPYTKTMFHNFTRYQKVLALQGESTDYTSGSQKKLQSVTVELLRLRDHPSVNGLIDIEERLGNLRKEQPELSQDEIKLLCQWEYEIVDGKDKIAKTNRDLANTTICKMLAAVQTSDSRPGMFKKHRVAIGFAAFTILILVGVYAYNKETTGTPGKALAWLLNVRTTMISTMK